MSRIIYSKNYRQQLIVNYTQIDDNHAHDKVHIGIPNPKSNTDKTQHYIDIPYIHI